jgi:signal peptidase I
VLSSIDPIRRGFGRREVLLQGDAKKMRKPVRLTLWVTLMGLTALRATSPLTLTVVRGHSMEPTLRPGALSLLDRSYYRAHPLYRGDIVVLRLRGETMIKRVYALPGDRLTLLRFDDNIGNRLLTPAEAARLRRLREPRSLPDHRVLSLTVPPRHCFLLGDNGPVSVDSRDWGPVPMSAILGRAFM